MTREEAIAFFKDMNECTYGNLEAVEMAIKALEQEPCEDCKSSKAIENCIKLHICEGEESAEHYKFILDELMDLPFVKPTVIHCKDCKHYEADPLNFCNLHGIVMSADEFCSYAESEGEE